MLKALAKLSNSGSSSAPSEEQIKKHKEKRQAFEQWKIDVDKLKNILKALTEAYSHHKGDFAIGRYEELKKMIKTAVQQLQLVATENKTNRVVMPAADKSSGSCDRLLESAATLAGESKRQKSSLDDKLYAEMTSKQAEQDTERIHRQIVELKHEFRILRDRLDRLARQYEESKRLNPTQRYTVLKDLIKTTIAD